MAGVKLTNIVGSTMWTDKKVEPFDIPSHQCGNVCDVHDHTKFVFWFLSNILARFYARLKLENVEFCRGLRLNFLSLSLNGKNILCVTILTVQLKK